MKYPRVLIVNSDIFNSYSGGGITLTNLFRGWPKAKIAAAHMESYVLDKSICENYYRLGFMEYGHVWPISMFEQKLWGKQREQLNTLLSDERMSTDDFRVTKIRMPLKSIYKVLSADGLRHRGIVSAQLRSWAQAFCPDIIYTQLGSLGFIRLVSKLNIQTRANMVIHMMDDWPSVRYRQGLLSGIFCRQMDVELLRVIQDAAVCMGISPAMGEAYQQRYGREFLSYSNALDTTAWMRLAKQDWNIDAPIKILYSGAILREAQLASLLEICRAVELLNQQRIAVEFIIHTPWPFRDAHQADFGGFAHVTLNGPLDDDTIASSLASADILALPVNFGQHTRRYVRYSNPTKLPAYMISGTPILAYGPRGVDQIDRAARDGWGYVVSEQGIENIISAIQELVQNPALREEIGREAQDVARRDHDVAVVRLSFQEAIQRATE